MRGRCGKSGCEREQRGGQGGADAQRQASAQRCCHEIPPRYENTRSYMQAPAERVNMAWPSGWALAVLRLGGAGGPALAVIAVGLAVAAADRLVDLVADRRPERAAAGLVGTAALPGLELAELAATAALQAGDAAARSAEPSRVSAGRERDQQGQRCE